MSDYAERNPDWHEGDAPHKAAALAELIRELRPLPRSVIDLGCGAGGVLRALRAELGRELQGTTWEGWDVAPEAIRRARAASPDLPFVLGDLLASDRRCDLLLAVDVAEHVPDAVGFLRAAATHAPRMLLRMPLDLSVLDVARPARLAGFRQRYGHVHAWTRELALATVEEAGLVVERERYHRIPPPRPGPLGPLRRWAAPRLPHVAARWLGGFSLLVSARVP